MASRRPNLPGSNIKRIYRHSTHIIHSETNFQERTLSYCRWLYMTLRPKTKGALLLLADQFFLCSDLLTISAMCKVVKIVNTILECLTLPTTFYLAYMNVRVNVTSDLSFLLNTTPFWCKNHFCGLKTVQLLQTFFQWPIPSSMVGPVRDWAACQGYSYPTSTQSHNCFAKLYSN